MIEHFALVLLLTFNLIVTFEITSLNDDNKTSNCDLWSQKNVLSNNEHHFYFEVKSYLIVITNFTELSKLSVCPKDKFKIEILLENVVKFYTFKLELFYESIFDLQNILNMFDLHLYTSDRIKIGFQNFAGFNFNSNFIGNNQFTLNRYAIQFFESKFAFYLNRKLVTKETCKWENFFEKSIFFGSIINIFFDEYTLYDSKICPYVFHNTQITNLALKNIANSFIFKNSLEFFDFENLKVNKVSISTYIQSLSLSLCFTRINSHLINKYVFKNLVNLYLIGIIYDIEADLFKNFKQIKFISLQSDVSFKDLFHSDLKWINVLNSNLRINMGSNREIEKTSRQAIVVEFYQMITLFRTDYKYPDEDFCIFKDFPFRQLVIPKFVLIDNPLCTCTLIWLLQYYPFYMNFDFFKGFSFNSIVSIDDLNITLEKCLVNLSFLVKSCDFETKLSQCSQNVQYNVSFETSFTGQKYLYFAFKWTDYIFEVYFILFFGPIFKHSNTFDYKK